MIDNSFTNIIGNKRFVNSPNYNTNLQLQLEQKTKPLVEYDNVRILNLQQVFEQEREECDRYRFNGKLNFYVSADVATGSTVYINGKYETSAWDPLFHGNPAVTPSNWVLQMVYPSDNDFNFLIESRNTNGTVVSNAYRGLQYPNLGSVLINDNNYLTINGVQNHNLSVGDYVYIYSNTIYNNLQGVHKIKYLGINGDNESKDLTFETVVNINSIPNGSGNFIKIYGVSTNDITSNNLQQTILNSIDSNISGITTGNFFVNDIIYKTITVTQEHKLRVGDFIEIKTNNLSKLNGVWKIENVITPFKFVIKFGVASTTMNRGFNNMTYSPLLSFRVFEGTPSEYYVRKFEVLTSNDYEVYPCAFSSNIYPDVRDVNLGLLNDTYMFQFNKDVKVNLTTNDGGPISEIYFGIIKRSGKYPYDWTNVTADWDFNYKTASLNNNPLETISVNNSSSIGSIEKVSARTETLINNGEDIIITNGSKYIGDFVEYNRTEIKQKTVSNVIHRFGPTSNTFGESYYYKPFKKLQLRVYSDYIETADADEIVVDLPGNYVTYPDGSIAWRDLLSIGYFEEGKNGVDYPFLNNSHYFYFNHNFYVRRQEPKNIIPSERRAKDLKVGNTECT
jgi:hypothetical protein